MTEIYSLTFLETRRLRSRFNRAMFPLKTREESPLAFSSFWWLAALPGVPWHVAASI